MAITFGAVSTLPAATTSAFLTVLTGPTTMDLDVKFYGQLTVCIISTTPSGYTRLRQVVGTGADGTDTAGRRHGSPHQARRSPHRAPASDGRDPLPGTDGQLDRAALSPLLRAAGHRNPPRHPAHVVHHGRHRPLQQLKNAYGHETGDRGTASLRASDCPDRSIRAHDVVGRHGDEEFVIALAGCTAESACDILNAFRPGSTPQSSWPVYPSSP